MSLESLEMMTSLKNGSLAASKTVADTLKKHLVANDVLPITVERRRKGAFSLSADLTIIFLIWT